MGGSGGSSGGFPASTHAIQVKIAQARAEEKERLNSDVDRLLRGLSWLKSMIAMQKQLGNALMWLLRPSAKLLI